MGSGAEPVSHEVLHSLKSFKNLKILFDCSFMVNLLIVIISNERKKGEEYCHCAMELEYLN